MATHTYASISRSRNELEHLSSLASELLEGLGSMFPEPRPSSPETRSATASDEVLAERIRDYLALRRRRDELFPPDLFADPAWEILLDLFVSGIEGRMVSISSACIASQCPPTTALRWIGRLEDLGLVSRIADGTDGRRSFLSLTRRADDLMRRWAQQMLRKLPCGSDHEVDL